MLNSIARRVTLAAALGAVGFGPGCGGDEDIDAPPATITIPPQPVLDTPKTAPNKPLPGSGAGSGSQPDPNVSP